MTRTAEERARDVNRLVDAARRCARDRGLVEEIARASGLSVAGVERAFERSLETDPSDAEIEALVATAGDAPRVTVILSANVFVAALRAVAIARAAAQRVIVRPSRREPFFPRALIEAAGDPAITVDPAIGIGDVESGELHVYGRDETIAFVRAHARGGVRVRGHGAGMGVAWISGDAALESAARLLADDVVLFDQRGCLSPRVALVCGDFERARTFADCAEAALEALSHAIPRGALTSVERAEAVRWSKSILYATGEIRAGDTSAVGVAPFGAPLLLPPPGRHLHVAPAADASGARALLAPLARAVVTVGSDDPAAASAIAPSHARLARLGEMQRPPFDGPVDRRGD
jgi:hypothetical protein